MIDRLDFRFGRVCEIKPFSEKHDSPRRKYCVIKIEFLELGAIKQSVGQFVHHRADMLGETVLCLTNLGTKNMFGQPSELLILGLPHPKGGVIPGDKHEAQATFLQPVTSIWQPMDEEAKPAVMFDDWLATDILLGEVIEQTRECLKVHVGDEVWTVPLPAPLSMPIVSQQVIVVRDRAHLLQGILPQTARGEPILAQPREKIDKTGVKIY